MFPPSIFAIAFGSISLGIDPPGKPPPNKLFKRPPAGGLLKSLFGGGLPGGSIPSEIDPNAMANMLGGNKGILPGKLPGLGNLPPNFPFGKKK